VIAKQIPDRICARRMIDFACAIDRDDQDNAE